MTERNWDQMGIEWTEGNVSSQLGNGRRSLVEVGQAQIPVLRDIGKAVEAGLGQAMLKGVNGTSWRVGAQEVCRRMLVADSSAGEAKMREAVWAWLMSIRITQTTVRVVEKVVEKVIREHRLADGTLYEGNDEIEFRQLYVASLVDMVEGIELNKAVAAADKQVW